MKTNENGVLKKSDLYFSSPSPTAKRFYYYPVSAGHFYCDKNYHLVRKNYESLLVTYIIDGEFTFALEDEQITAKTGEIVILNCFEPHEYYTNSSFESVWVHFNGPNCLDFYNEIAKNEGNLIKHHNNEYIKSLIYSLFNSMNNEENDSEIKLSLDIYSLLAELASHTKTNRKNNLKNEESMNRAKKYIAENLNENISVKKLANTVHMSESHFSRIFKQHTGFSPYDYVLISRLNKAKEYLQKTDMTVTQIAYETGFNSDANFIHFFSINTGLSPNKFRKLKF